MKRILIVDDEPHMTHVLKLYLQRAGYSVETVPNGQVALASILKNAPDVMVTDIQMPIMTGKELCLALEEQYPERMFPIFVMTSMVDREHREWTQKINNLKFLEKPLSMRALTRELDKHFGIESLASAVASGVASHV
ncbi:MAG: response regulator [Methylotenera sp.]|uniref:response regulator n=1 Tax=Methylotenera sp. TaxID=2051956 RepID=UPI00272222CD|nr:response regulator [Methylotenera sp.]MDO9393043.1 response regulator [Methylotenera sp.]MDP1523928.1 response regulator [Methylotenera sp.]MDZ4211711.1 response regulator [Methylotenera sp.]